MTQVQAARQLLRFAETHLPKTQLTALSMWLQGSEESSIEHELELPPGEGRRAMRSAVAALRRHFRDSIES